MGASLTEREMDVMAVLWNQGPATVNEVKDALEDRLAYTTVLTMLRILEEKGIVGHTKEGRAHRFHPLVERKEAGDTVLDRLRDKVFSGSTELLMTHLVSDTRLTPETMKRLRALLDERLNEEEES